MNTGIVRFLVGIVVYVLIYACFSDGLMFLFASVVCTGGLGLIVHIPAAWLTGKIVYYLINVSANKKNKQVVNKKDLAISSFVYQARQAGLSDIAIKNKLRDEGGWAEGDINKFF
jgi:hypothetical protein